MNKQDKILVAGGSGMVGGAIINELAQRGYTNILTTHFKKAPSIEISKTVRWIKIDLTRQLEVENLFSTEKPAHVFLAAAKVGGILANDTAPADFIRDNLAIQTNVITASHLHNVNKLLFLGSSCIYPRDCPQPIREEYLLTGPLEPTNEAYAIAKIAGIKMCESFNKQYGTNFFSVMPTNLYGEHDNFDLQTSHVIPALIRKFHEAKVSGAKSVTLWGSGTPKREFLHVDELAKACVHLMELPGDTLKDFFTNERISCLNIGTGVDLSIRELAEKISVLTNYTGTIEWDKSKPDGTPRKLLDVGRIKRLGWRDETLLNIGLKNTYEWFARRC